MNCNGEQKAEILGRFFELGQDAHEIAEMFGNRVNPETIEAIIDQYVSMRTQEEQQLTTHLTNPPLTKWFPPQSGHRPAVRSMRLPGCDGQMGPDPGYFGDHPADRA